MDKIIRNFSIGLALLIILAPLGLLAVGETFGEWGPEEIKEKLGFVPPAWNSFREFGMHLCPIMPSLATESP